MQTRLKQVIYVSEKTDTSSDSLTDIYDISQKIIRKVDLRMFADRQQLISSTFGGSRLSGRKPVLKN